MASSRLLLYAIALLILSGCAATSDTSNKPVQTTVSAPSAAEPAAHLPAGWRWESYDHLQIAVPGEWEYGTTDRPWCQRPANEKPFVGRPGAVRDIGCIAANAGQAPGTALATGGVFVWFDNPLPESGSTSHTSARDTAPVRSGDRETLTVAGTRVAVQATPPLRRQILSTLTVLDQRDHNNCDLTSPSADNADWRPTGPPVTELTGVKAISACNYAGGALISSVRLHGPAAARAIAAVRKAPFGAGPTSPTEDCLPDDLTAVEHLILRVESDSGAGIIVLRYGGCFHRGFDDGTTVRTLTRAGVQPFVTGPNRVTGWNGEQMSAVLAPCSPSRSTC